MFETAVKSEFIERLTDIYRYYSSWLFVRLSVRSHITKTSRPNFTKFSVHVSCGRCSVFLWLQCDTLCISGLWMASCFYTIERMWQNQKRHSSSILTATAVSARVSARYVRKANVRARYDRNAHVTAAVRTLLYVSTLVSSSSPDGGTGGEVCRNRLLSLRLLKLRFYGIFDIYKGKERVKTIQGLSSLSVRHFTLSFRSVFFYCRANSPEI